MIIKATKYATMAMKNPNHEQIYAEVRRRARARKLRCTMKLCIDEINRLINNAAIFSNRDNIFLDSLSQRLARRLEHAATNMSKQQMLRTSIRPLQIIRTSPKKKHEFKR